MCIDIPDLARVDAPKDLTCLLKLMIELQARQLTCHTARCR